MKFLVNALPARFETHRVEGVPIVVDGGHNPSGVEAALDAMDGVYGDVPLAVVFGVLRDKDAVSMLTTLSRSARTVVLTRPEGERAADPAEISAGRQEAEGGQILTEEDPVEAVRAAIRSVEEDGGAVLVIGSFATAAPVLRWLRDG